MGRVKTIVLLGMPQQYTLLTTSAKFNKTYCTFPHLLPFLLIFYLLDIRISCDKMKS
jgi:hypothetical protein